MLTSLYIENIAVIERMELSFEQGFSVLTGETGAGKSILIHAINALMGERFHKDMIRTGTSRARVSAVFSDLPEHTLQRLAAQGIYPDEDGVLIISREISADAKGICRIAGVHQPVSVLKAVTGELIGILGQQDNRLLLDADRHVQYIDAFLEDPAVLDRYAQAYKTYTAIKKELSAICTDEKEKQRRIEMLSYQISDIEQAGLQEGEDEALLAARKRILGAEKIANSVYEGYHLLGGTQDTEGLCDLLSQLENCVAQSCEYLDELVPMRDRITEMAYELEDCKETLRDLSETLEYDPAELDRIERRLDVIYKLKSKYGSDVAEILHYLQRSQAELDAIVSQDQLLIDLEAQLQAAEKELEQAAASLSRGRRDAAQVISAGICRELAFLNMPNIHIEAQFQDCGYTPNGAEKIEFLLSANPGEPLKPLAKIASGGELSRIMLAIQSVLAEKDNIDTIIFDEIDTGVSGRAAYRVGQKLKEVAGSRQVLCVTHLPQVAAQSSHHFLIEKNVSEGHTYTTASALDHEGRIEELARMIGGNTITAAARTAAEEMLLNGTANEPLSL